MLAAIRVLDINHSWQNDEIFTRKLLSGLKSLVEDIMSHQELIIIEEESAITRQDNLSQKPTIGITYKETSYVPVVIFAICAVNAYPLLALVFLNTDA